jgi:predicted ArsR family transcriptional regulator
MSTTTTRNAGKAFTDRAVNFLIGNAGLMTATAIAGRLGRTTKAVRRKAEKLGVKLSVN